MLIYLLVGLIYFMVGMFCAGIVLVQDDDNDNFTIYLAVTTCIFWPLIIPLVVGIGVALEARKKEGKK